MEAIQVREQLRGQVWLRLVALTFVHYFDLICGNIKPENFVNAPVVGADLQVGAAMATLSRRIS